MSSKILKGVHFTPSWDLAAAYAYKAVEVVAERFDYDDVSVIFEADLTGYRRKPDLDAVLETQELLRVPREQREIWDEDLYEAQGECEFDDSPDPPLALPEAFRYLVNLLRYPSCPPMAFKTQEEWNRWRETGKYTAENMIRLTEQFKVVRPVPWSRIHKVYILKPVFPRVTDLEPEFAEEIEEKTGWQIISWRDPQEQESEWTALDGPSKTTSDVYHGTSGTAAAEAFPHLERELPEVTPIDEVERLVAEAEARTRRDDL